MSVHALKPTPPEVGHPIGASGARIMVSLISALRDRGVKLGIACFCIGGVEATAFALEIL